MAKVPAQGAKPPADLPVRIGPVEFRMVGSMVGVRCPRELDPLMRKAGPVVRELRRDTDPLFRQAGISLDGEGNR